MRETVNYENDETEADMISGNHNQQQQMRLKSNYVRASYEQQTIPMLKTERDSQNQQQRDCQDHIEISNRKKDQGRVATSRKVDTEEDRE